MIEGSQRRALFFLSSRLREAHGEISFLVISTKRSAWRDLSTTLEMTERALEMTKRALEMTKSALEMTEREGKNARYSSVVCRLDPDHLGGTGFHRAPKRFPGYFAHHDLFRKVKGHFA